MMIKSRGITKKQRLLFSHIIVFVIVIILLWGGWYYTRSNNFPINRVKVVASYEHLDRNFLQELVASYTSKGFFYISVIEIQHKLKKIPWIKTVWIEREWPDTIIIHVVEQQAILQWGSEGLINGEGVFFAPAVDTFPEGLPIIHGPKEQRAEIFALYKTVQKMFDPLNLIVKKIDFNVEQYWEIKFHNELVVYLKAQEPLVQLELLCKLYPKIVSGHQDQPKSIDMRYNTSGLAVQW